MVNLRQVFVAVGMTVESMKYHWKNHGWNVKNKWRQVSIFIKNLTSVRWIIVFLGPKEHYLWNLCFVRKKMCMTMLNIFISVLKQDIGFVRRRRSHLITLHVQSKINHYFIQISDCIYSVSSQRDFLIPTETLTQKLRSTIWTLCCDKWYHNYRFNLQKLKKNMYSRKKSSTVYMLLTWCIKQLLS